VKEATLGGYERQDVPFEKVVEALKPERGGGEAPLFSVKLTYENFVKFPLRLPGLQCSGLQMPSARHARFPLTFTFTDTPQGFWGSISYMSGLFDEQAIRHFAACYVEALGLIVDQPDIGLEILGARLDELNSAHRLQREQQWQQARSQRWQELRRVPR
jgi:non-ribosomal peptide synthetase component F